MKLTSLRTNGKSGLYLKFKCFTSIDVFVLGQFSGSFSLIDYSVLNSPSGGSLPYSINLSVLAISPLKLTIVSTN